MKEVNVDKRVESIEDARERREQRRLENAMRHPAQIVDWDEYEYDINPHHLTKAHRLSRK